MMLLAPSDPVSTSRPKCDHAPPHHADGLGLETVGIELEKGKVPVDAHFRTKVSNIYAIGDCIPGPMLAHKAEEDGVAAAEIIAGRDGHVNYNTVPNIIYTHPEVAHVGVTEAEAKEAGHDVAVGKFSFMANSRARCALNNLRFCSASFWQSVWHSPCLLDPKHLHSSARGQSLLQLDLTCALSAHKASITPQAPDTSASGHTPHDIGPRACAAWRLAHCVHQSPARHHHLHALSTPCFPLPTPLPSLRAHMRGSHQHRRLAITHCKHCAVALSAINYNTHISYRVVGNTDSSQARAICQPLHP